MMNLLKKIFKKEIKDEFSEVPESVCPNCWGHQEYGNLVREKYKDAQISVNNKESKYAFIQEFIVTNVKGIHLKSTINGQECSTCKTVYDK